MARPMVVAHRGSSYAVAEHTLAAYEQAMDEGSDALECDVRLTRDGHLVCVHDRRIDRTTSARGVVSALELADLAQLDFASWRADLRDEDLVPGTPYGGEEVDRDRHGVVTLERLLDLVTSYGRFVELHVETKHPTRYAGLVEQTLVRLLKRHGLASPTDPRRSRVTVMSFSSLGLRRIRLLAPRLPTVLLLERVPPIRRDGSLPVGVGAAGPSIRVLRAHPGFVERVHRRGHRLHVWTVDEPDDIDLVLGLGVDAVITNRPRDVLTAVADSS